MPFLSRVPFGDVTNNFANTYELLDYVKIVKSKIINDFKYVFDVVIDISVDI